MCHGVLVDRMSFTEYRTKQNPNKIQSKQMKTIICLLASDNIFFTGMENNMIKLIKHKGAIKSYFVQLGRWSSILLVYLF